MLKSFTPWTLNSMLDLLHRQYTKNLVQISLLGLGSWPCIAYLQGKQLATKCFRSRREKRDWLRVREPCKVGHPPSIKCPMCPSSLISYLSVHPSIPGFLCHQTSQLYTVESTCFSSCWTPKQYSTVLVQNPDIMWVEHFINVHGY